MSISFLAIFIPPIKWDFLLQKNTQLYNDNYAFFWRKVQYDICKKICTFESVRIIIG